MNSILRNVHQLFSLIQYPWSDAKPNWIFFLYKTTCKQTVKRHMLASFCALCYRSFWPLLVSCKSHAVLIIFTEMLCWYHVSHTVKNWYQTKNKKLNKGCFQIIRWTQMNHCPEYSVCNLVLRFFHVSGPDFNPTFSSQFLGDPAKQEGPQGETEFVRPFGPSSVGSSRSKFKSL